MALICCTGARLCDGCGACGNFKLKCSLCGREAGKEMKLYDICGGFVCESCLPGWLSAFEVRPDDWGAR